MAFLYETHLHTCQGSGCGVSFGREHVPYYLDQGFTGIIITDHFFRGNTAIPRDWDWERRVRAFWEGYEDAFEEGTKRGLDVFFGLEEHYQGDEYLVYGLTKEYMLNHPEMEHWTRRQQLEEVHRAGGCVVQAHPFRMRDYMEKIRLGELFCDGIEAANGGNTPFQDARAYRRGKAMDMVMTAGSDNHRSPAKNCFGVELERRLTCIGDYVRVILNREPIGLHVPPERLATPEDWTEERDRPWYVDAEEQTIPLENDRNW